MERGMRLSFRETRNSCHLSREEPKIVCQKKDAEKIVGTGDHADSHAGGDGELSKAGTKA
jgi:hypothetical protein